MKRIIIIIFTLTLMSFLFIPDLFESRSKEFFVPKPKIFDRIAITNVNLIRMIDNQIETNMSVLIENGRIQKIQSSEVTIDGNYKFINGERKYLMPGLADFHTHVRHKEDLILYIANGVTSIMNMGSGVQILRFRDSVNKQELVGPRIYAGAFVDGVNRGYHADSKESAIEVVRRIKARNWDFIKAYNSLSKDAFDGLMQEVQIQNLSVLGHGIREPGMEYILKNGYKAIAHGEEFIYSYFNGRDESKIPDAIELLKKTQAYVIPNLSTYSVINQQWGEDLTEVYRTRVFKNPLVKYLHPDVYDGWKSADTYANRNGSLNLSLLFLQKFTKAMSNAEIGLLLGTDSPANGIMGTFPGFSIHDDLKEMHWAGLSNYEILKAGTKTAGEFIKRDIRPDVQIGLVKEGYLADLILLNKNPLEDIENIKELSAVIFNQQYLTKEELDDYLEKLAASYDHD